MTRDLLAQSFIVRIYRRGSGRRRAIVGVVEEVGKTGKSAFTDFDELWGILNKPKRLTRRLDRQASGGKGPETSPA
jgi:hypothetical protein